MKWLRRIFRLGKQPATTLGQALKASLKINFMDNCCICTMLYISPNKETDIDPKPLFFEIS
jgi:hypothetical protein